ncbi:hypothetical protein [Thiohalorhabdus methylotrophus]|uniref:Uncharacterized protein n=1 Tax=Thiohalorhabdus methylotrophus TaxID=3242694 RepID=A0ABV4TSU0_9GAMM
MQFLPRPGTPAFGLLRPSGSSAAFAILLLTATAVGATSHYDRIQCLGCHGGDSREVVDPETGERRDVALDMARYRHGAHRALDCLACHERGFRSFPHNAKKPLTCMECHPREEAEGREATFDFRRWERQFKDSIHFTRHKKRFNCGECHNPHYFRVAEELGAPPEIIDTHNRWCLRCHKERAGRFPLSNPADPDMVGAHAWLPHTALHLRETRCVECHTSNAAPVSHDLLIWDEAKRDCVICHSRDTVLQRTLYRHHPEVPARLGFTNTAVLQDGYVMAANRNRYLDLLFYLVVGLAFLYVFGHAGIRWRRRRRGLSGGGGRQ